jgi:hypothetical protein
MIYELEPYRGVDPRHQNTLMKEIDTAIAWGRPDKESIGLSTDEFIRLLRRAKKRILELEKQT